MRRVSIILASIICFFWGHDETWALVHTKPTWRGRAHVWDGPEPNDGFATICVRCKKQLTETQYEYPD